ncbi:MAG: DUF533 domain-containing protein [Candidatus Poseidoniales archaeon]|nr:MAG: hypothetical protein CMA23_006995 [Euryarchaeota archaeon]RCH73901.1 MAG: DUF533 domain-containing protein [Candidatus Poseidoniales archaeon]
MLPDVIDRLDENDREGYVRILISLAGADGTLVREETAAIEAAMGRALIPPHRRNVFRQELKRSIDLSEIIDGMGVPALRLALRDAAIVGACDGEFQEEEIEFLKQLAVHADVDEETLAKVLKWVDQGWTWIEKSRRFLGIRNQDIGKYTENDDD